MGIPVPWRVYALHYTDRGKTKGMDTRSSLRGRTSQSDVRYFICLGIDSRRSLDARDDAQFDCSES